MKSSLHINKKAQLKGHNGAIYALDQTKQGARFFSAAGDGWIVEWDLENPENGKLIAQVETGVFSICHLVDHQKLVAGNRLGGLHWIDLNDRTKTKNIKHHQQGVFGLMQIGDHLLSLGGEGVLTLWSIASQRSLESFHLSNQHLRGLAYSPKRNELAIAASDQSIYFLDASDLSLKNRIISAHNQSVFCLQYTADEKFLISGGRDAQLNVWSLENNFEKIQTILAHMYTINALSFHPKGHLMASASRDKTVKIWKVENWELLAVLDVIKYGGHVNSVNDLIWSSFQNTLITASDDRTIILWEIDVKKP